MYYSQNPENPASLQSMAPLTGVGWFLASLNGLGRARDIPETDKNPRLRAGRQSASGCLAYSRGAGVRRTSVEAGRPGREPDTMPSSSLYRYFNTSPEIISLTMIRYIRARFPL